MVSPSTVISVSFSVPTSSRIPNWP